MSQRGGKAYRHAGALLRTDGVGTAVTADPGFEVAGCGGAQAAHSPITVKITKARISRAFIRRRRIPASAAGASSGPRT
jgi:hypothetical protein